jgi:hypothetical protein
MYQCPGHNRVLVPTDPLAHALITHLIRSREN